MIRVRVAVTSRIGFEEIDISTNTTDGQFIGHVAALSWAHRHGAPVMGPDGVTRREPSSLSAIQGMHITGAV